MSYRQKLFLLLFTLLVPKTCARIYRIWHPPHVVSVPMNNVPRTVR